MKKHSVAGVARSAKAEEKKMVAAKVKQTTDSFANLAQSLGVGSSGSPLSTVSYGFNPLTNQRTQLEWMHRGSWLAGVAVDVVAEDMTRAGVEVVGKMKPQEISELEECAVTLGIWTALNKGIKWGRLYGGALSVIMIEGQDLKTPLRLETVGPGMFKGLYAMDRWMVEPSLNDLVQDLGPDLGLPKFYNVTVGSPAFSGAKIHYSRVIRHIGVDVPYWQGLTLNLWGVSIIERLYDRMVAFDSATTGAAQLVYKSYIRTVKIKGMREVVAIGGPALVGLLAQMEFMRKYQGIEGLNVIDAEDDFIEGGANGFSGLSDALTQFGQQLAGALQIPLVRLFGQSPAGFSTGETDLRMYYDSIKQQQEKTLKVGITRAYRCMAQSEKMKVPDGFGIKFRTLWQLTEEEKANIASIVGTTISTALQDGLVSDKVAMQELKQSSILTGVFSNITDEDINAASDEPAPAATEATVGELEEGGEAVPGQSKGEVEK